MRQTPASIGTRRLALAGLILLAWITNTGKAQTSPTLPRHSWSLHAEHFRDQQLTPTQGTLQGKMAGPLQFSRGHPKAMVLDGKTNDIRVANISPQQEATRFLPTKSITVETWIYIDRIQPWGSMVSAIQDNGDYERGWMLGIREDMFCFGLASASTNRITYLTNPQPFLPGSHSWTGF